ncbi:MAG: homoserine kinase [Geminicoccaceae bacterium]
MAVYTEIDTANIEELLERYDVGRLTTWHGIAEGVENSNFFVATDRQRCVLTIYEKRVDPDDLPFFLGLMRHLADRGIRCPVPLEAKNGQALQEVLGKPAALVTFLEGYAVRRITVPMCHDLGRALAAMHVAGQDYRLSRPNALGHSGWRPLFSACAARADEVAPGLADEVSGELETLARDWPTDLPRGVIHADLFPDNVFFDGERVSGLIDFYFACSEILVYDLAICLNAWCFERDGSYNATKARALTRGYGEVRPLDRREIESLPLLASGAAMRFLLTRLYDWLHRVEGALVTPKDPTEYLKKLRFHRGLDGPGLYGLA